MQNARHNFTVKEQLEDFLGININGEGDKFNLTQPKLIQSITKELGLALEGEKAPSIRDIPMLSSKQLSRHLDSASRL